MIATIASSISANRIKRSLAAEGVHLSVIQTPHRLTREGCGYSIRFDDDMFDQVKRTAEELNIKVRAYYAEQTIDGKKEYFKL